MKQGMKIDKRLSEEFGMDLPPLSLFEKLKAALYSIYYALKGTKP